MGYVTPVDASMKAKAFLSGPIATQIWHIDDQGAIHALYQPEGKTEGTSFLDRAFCFTDAVYLSCETSVRTGLYCYR